MLREQCPSITRSKKLVKRKTKGVLGKKAAKKPTKERSVNISDDFSEFLDQESEIDIDIARKVPGVVASRLTGAGFGGCTVSIVQGESAVKEFSDALDNKYTKITGLKHKLYDCRITDALSFHNM